MINIFKSSFFLLRFFNWILINYFTSAKGSDFSAKWSDFLAVSKKIIFWRRFSASKINENAWFCNIKHKILYMRYFPKVWYAIIDDLVNKLPGMRDFEEWSKMRNFEEWLKMRYFDNLKIFYQECEISWNCWKGDNFTNCLESSLISEK